MQYNTAFICSFFCLAAMASVPPPPAGQTLQPAPLDPETLEPDPRVKLSKLPITIVFSLGGLRRSFVDQDLTPNLNILSKEHASADKLIPEFPTKTSVNHFSVATGLHAGEHGVLYDCKFDEKPENPCEYEQYNQTLNPLWIENQIKGGVSGVLNWPGSDKEYLGQKPVHRIGPGEVCEDPLMKMIEWLEHETQPANLIMAYFGKLDQKNHDNGPLSTRVQSEMRKMDRLVKNFIDELKIKRILQFINIIIIGTQGIFKTVHEKGIYLDRFLNNDEIPIKIMGANAIISPRTDIEYADVYKNLKDHEYFNIDMADQQYTVYENHEIPDYWYLKDLFKEKLFLVAKAPYFFWNDYLHEVEENLKSKYANPSGYERFHKDFEVGMDGYSNVNEFMATLFIGMGPNFQPRTHVNFFYVIDIHPLIRELLNLEGHISDSQSQTLLNESIRPLLRDPVFTSMEKIEREIDVRGVDIVQRTKHKRKTPRGVGCLSYLFGSPRK